jgi:hypothetical protein
MISDDLRRWLYGASPRVAGRALLGIGLQPEELEVVRSKIGLGQLPIVRWSLDEGSLRDRTTATPDEMASWLPDRLESLRVAIDTPAPPAGIARQLLLVDGIASAFVAVERPEGLLRPRRWSWPLRIGLAGFPEGTANAVTAEVGQTHRVLPRMLEVRALEDEPGGVDILVLRGPLVDAVAHLVRLRPVANTVLVVDEPIEPPRVVEAQLATLRAATGAQSSAIVLPDDLPAFLAEMTRQLSHAEPLDTALTVAAERDVLLLADPEAIAAPLLPGIARQNATMLRRAQLLLADTGIELGDVARKLDEAATGAFRRESHEARTILDLTSEIDLQLAAREEPRWCQAIVGEAGDNVLRSGPNRVSFFIGPLVDGALPAPSPLVADLPWDAEGADSFRLTVLFVPADDRTVQRAELDLPRFGPSPAVPFTLTVQKGSPSAARIIVLFRNRVLQTAMLAGEEGQVARLSDVVALVGSLADLDGRHPFDAALVANCHEDTRTVTVVAAGEVFVTEGGSIPERTEQIVSLLRAAGETLPSASGLAARGARKKLVELAVEGRELWQALRHELTRFEEAKRIQIVSLNGARLLPLELVYGRPAPEPGATICPRFLTDPESCTGNCDSNPRKSVCPNAFWGLSKTIERHRADPTDGSAQVHRVLEASRDEKLGPLVGTRALLGTSTRVSQDDVGKLLEALGADASPAESWDQWEQELTKRDTELLVLLPHTNYNKRTLEIARDPLASAYLEPSYVTGNRKVAPIVVLFGCRTTGTNRDPGGFAALFQTLGARAVFHSFADLRGPEATELALRLTKSLAPAERTIGAVLTGLRRQAVRDGWLTALAITAFGDVDWKV